jgi:hypothetical protein
MPAKAKPEREKALEERDHFQEDQDSNRSWHRPQEHQFSVDVSGEKSKPIVGGTAAGTLFLDTNGEAQLDSEQVHTLISQLQAAFQAVS